MAGPFQTYDNTTLRDFLFKECSESLLDELARDSEGDYWQNAQEFVEVNEDRAMGALSPRQRKFAQSIKDGLMNETGRRF